MDAQTTPQKTFQMVECGNLDLNFPIQRAVLLLGVTKAGKTTSSHYMARQLLRPALNDVGKLTYQIRAADKRYLPFTIGSKQHVSETQIPNIFLNNICNPAVAIIDCPGYLDTNGCSKMLSNSYFHFLIFKQVKSAKFILTIQASDIQTTAANFRLTFKSFYDSFIDFRKNSESILNATCLLITKVDPNRNQDYFAQNLRRLNPFRRGEIKTAYDNFIQEIITKNKIFIFNKAEQGRNSDQNNNLLSKINQRTDFWQHSLSDVKVSIGDKLLNKTRDEQDFQQQLQQIGGYYKSLQYKKFQKLSKIVNVFIDDAFSINMTNNYVSLIEQYVRDQILVFEDTNSHYKIYQQKRTDTRSKLFQSLRRQRTQSSSSQKPDWITKIEIVQKFYKQMRSFDTNAQYSLELVNSYSETIIGLLHQMLILNRGNNQIRNIVLKFVYDIENLLHTSNSIYHILLGQKMQNPDTPLAFIRVDYPLNLKDFIANRFEKSLLSKKINLIRNIDFRDQRRISANNHYTQIQDFIYQLQSQISQKKCQDLNAQLSEFKQQIKQIQQKFANIRRSLGLSCIQQDFKQRSPNKRKLCQISSSIYQLQEIRRQLEQQLLSKKQLDQNTLSIRIKRARTINMLAQAFLQINGSGSQNLAIQLYQFNCNAHKILSHYQKRQKQIKLRDQRSHKHIVLLIKYCLAANKYGMTDLALQKYHEAVDIAIQNEDESSIDKLNRICISLNIQQKEDKLVKIYFDKYSKQEFPKDLVKRIEQYFLDPYA